MVSYVCGAVTTPLAVKGGSATSLLVSSEGFKAIKPFWYNNDHSFMS